MASAPEVDHVLRDGNVDCLFPLYQSPLRIRLFSLLAMRKFLIKVLAFTLIFFLVDKLALLLLDKAPQYAYDPRLGMVMEGEMNKDIIIAGSSRGAKGVVAKMIEDSTGYSTYNLSYNGTDVAFHEFIIRALLKNNEPPKAIFLTADDPTQLWQVDNYGFRADLVIPLSNYDLCNEELITNNVNSVASRYFLIPRLRYQHWFPKEEKIPVFDTLRPGGSQWLSYYPEKRDFIRYCSDYEFEKELEWKKLRLKKIKDLCQEKGVQLIMVYPPNFKEHNLVFENRMRDLMGPEVLHCVYDHTDSVYFRKDLFYDPDHLHVSGARVFTREVVSYIRELDL